MSVVIGPVCCLFLSAPLRMCTCMCKPRCLRLNVMLYICFNSLSSVVDYDFGNRSWRCLQVYCSCSVIRILLLRTLLSCSGSLALSLGFSQSNRSMCVFPCAFVFVFRASLVVFARSLSICDCVWFFSIFQYSLFALSGVVSLLFALSGSVDFASYFARCFYVFVCLLYIFLSVYVCFVLCLLLCVFLCLSHCLLCLLICLLLILVLSFASVSAEFDFSVQSLVFVFDV